MPSVVRMKEKTFNSLVVSKLLACTESMSCFYFRAKIPHGVPLRAQNLPKIAK